MEPRIQYAQTADGVSIAFWTLGEGMPFVHMTPPPWSHIQAEWQVPEIRRWLERLAQRKRVIRYDGRGTGLSDRVISDYSLDAQVLDLEAVVHNLGLQRFALFAYTDSGPAAITYAVRHPERVSHLILWCSWAAASDFLGGPEGQADRTLIEKDWNIYTETVSRMLLGWSVDEDARQAAALLRESTTQETAQKIMNVIWELDVGALLPQVRSPTLVMHRSQYRYVDVGVAKRLTSRIPDGRLVLLEGATPVPYLENTEAVLQAIGEFLGLETEEAAATAEPPAPGAFRTVLFTDVEGSTALTQRLGDVKAQEVLRTHNTIVRDALKAHGGSEVKALGDGFMTSFSSATKALECAIAIQRAFAAHNESAEEPIRVRIGLNAGEPVAEEEDLFGTAVQLAARICAHSEPGEILAPIVVRELAAGKGFLFADRGDVALRGFEDPVRLYEVRWREEG